MCRFAFPITVMMNSLRTESSREKQYKVSLVRSWLKIIRIIRKVRAFWYAKKIMNSDTYMSSGAYREAKQNRRY